jgi:hypothetical protein
MPVRSVGAGLLKADVDFSNYDTPLFQQIVNRIKDKVSARLGEGVNTQDRYFIVPFAFQKRWNNPQFSHPFISVIRVLGDGTRAKLSASNKCTGSLYHRNSMSQKICIAASIAAWVHSGRRSPDPSSGSWSLVLAARSVLA